MISGHATPEGTKRFAARFLGSTFRPDFYKLVEGLTLSTLGIGTYLGEMDNADDLKMETALSKAILSGINVIDTAINYRGQRSERVIGKVLGHLIGSKQINRDEIFISTKGGFIPFDHDMPSDPASYFRDRFLKTQLLTEKDIVSECHSLAPVFIANQFEESQKNLGLETIDLYYLHNPEVQLEEIYRDDFLLRLHRAFAVLEEKRRDKNLQFYGMATWNGFRVGEHSKELLKLEEIMEVANEHGESSAFKFIQLPFNVDMPEALTNKNQEGKSVLEKAREFNINVMTSASLMQAKVLGQLSLKMNILTPGKSDAVKALNYVRSAPGINVALCGTKNEKHVVENLGLAQIPPLSLDQFREILG